MNESDSDCHDLYKVNSLILKSGSSAVGGHVKWDPWRSLWNGAILLGALVLGPMTFTWGALAVCLLLLSIIMCAGHSVGFHRLLIHRSFECPKWLERTAVWLGVLFGMQGPYWMMRTHDFRDWAQRQSNCHAYLRHGANVLRDGWWNLHCRLVLDDPPDFDPGEEVANDRFYRFLQHTWMAQQIPLAAVLFLLGGLPWVVWGILVRIALGVHSHWYVGYLCHKHGPQDWLVDDGVIQAHNVPWAAIPSMGECWHNNHHAFPTSARHGLYAGQPDPGYRFIELLQKFGLAWNVRVADNLPPRNGITPLTQRGQITLAMQHANATRVAA
ncbi:acyl-CoA desaturase [Candidatus Foliamicus sp.]